MVSEFELKIGVGSGNFNYEREGDFVLLWGWVAGFARVRNRAKYRISVLTWFCKLTSAKTTSCQKRTYCAYSCVRFQCKQWITTALYPVTYCQTYPLSLDYIIIMRLYISLFVLASGIMTSLVSDILEASICNLDTSIDVGTGMPSFGKTSSEPRFQGTVKRVHNRVLRYRFPAEFFMIILPSHPKNWVEFEFEFIISHNVI